RIRPAPWTNAVGSEAEARWRVVTRGTKTRARDDPEPASRPWRAGDCPAAPVSRRRGRAALVCGSRARAADPATPRPARFGRSTARVLPEPGDGQRPGGLARPQVGAVTAVLGAQEAVPRAGEGVVLEHLAERLHGRVRGRDRGVDPRVVACVHPEH